MHAIILAGGFGTRLRSVVADVPKPLAPIGERPFLALLIDSLASQGITGITLSVHHQWEKIRDYFAQHPAPVPVHYAVEQEPLGTGGAIAFSLTHAPKDAPALVLNGDTFVTLDYPSFFAAHKSSGRSLTMALRHVPDTGRYGQVLTQGSTIVEFAEGKAGQPGLINAGVYAVAHDIFAGFGMPAEFSFERDFVPVHLATLKPNFYKAEDYFIDIGIPDDYARAQTELPRLIA